MGSFWYTSMPAVTLCKKDLYLFYEVKFGILIFMHGKLLGLEESGTRSLNTERNR